MADDDLDDEAEDAPEEGDGGSEGPGEDAAVSAEAEEGSGEDGDALPDFEAEEDEEAPPISRQKRILIVASTLTLVLGLGLAGAYFGGFLEALLLHPSEETEEETAGPSIYYEMPEFLVDLKTGECKAPYLKAQIVVELAEEDDLLPRMAELQPALLDAIQTFIRDHERAEVVGKAGVENLRKGLLVIVNEGLKPKRARNILFRKFILQ